MIVEYRKVWLDQGKLRLQLNWDQTQDENFGHHSRL